MSKAATIRPANYKTSTKLATRTNLTAKIRAATAVDTNFPAVAASAIAILNAESAPQRELATTKPTAVNANDDLAFAERSFKHNAFRKTRRQRPYDHHTLTTQKATPSQQQEQQQQHQLQPLTLLQPRTQQQQQRQRQRQQQHRPRPRPQPLITNTFATTTTKLTAAIAAALLQTTNATTATLTAALQTHTTSIHEVADATSFASYSASSPAATHIPPPLSIADSSSLQYPVAVLDGTLAQTEPNVTATHLLHNTAISTATSALSSIAAAATVSTANTTILLQEGSGGGGGADVASDWFDDAILALKASVMLFIIIAAIFGNLLVIISVMRVRKLR